MGTALPAITLTCTQTFVCALACTLLPCAFCEFRCAFDIQHKMRIVTKWKCWLEVKIQWASC